METTKATIFYRNTSMGMGNMVKQEIHLDSIGQREYAQYSNLPFANFIPKRKRTMVELLDSTVKPSIVILEGWGHDLEPQSMFDTENAKTDENGTTVTQGRYRSFAPEWQENFNAQLATYLEANPMVEVIADFREVEIMSDRWEKPKAERKPVISFN